MEQIDRIMLGRSAREAGFVRDTFEKAYRLVRVLDAFQYDSLLSDRLALKGGTAINMTVFNLPRLSVDIDLDLSENLSRNKIMLIRESIKEHILKHMAASDYSVSPRSKSYHVLDSFVFEYHKSNHPMALWKCVNKLEPYNTYK